MRLLVLLCIVGIAGAASTGCTPEQKAKFQTAMTGAPPAPPSPAANPGANPAPTGDGGIIGDTKKVGDTIGAAAAVTAGTPIGGYLAIASTVFSGLLVLERLALAAGINLPNSKSSPSPSIAGSGGGTNSDTGQPSTSNTLKAA